MQRSKRPPHGVSRRSHYNEGTGTDIIIHCHKYYDTEKYRTVEKHNKRHLEQKEAQKLLKEGGPLS